MILFLFLASVQIMVESLPISSSGHLALASQICSSLGYSCQLSSIVAYILHIPTACMLAYYFYPRWSFVIAHPVRMRNVIKNILMYGFCAEIVSVVLYCFVSVTYAHFVPLWIGFLVTALLLFSTKLLNNSYKQVTLGKSILIGCAQGLAVFPGVSRLAATYTVGRWVGLAPRISFLFSCMIQWPLIVAGSLLGIFTRHEDMHTRYFYQGWFLIGILCATVGAYYFLKIIEKQIEAGTIWKWGYWLCCVALLSFFIVS